MQKKKIVFYIIFILLIALIAVFLYKYRLKIGRITAPFFMAVPVAYIVKPLSSKLVKKKIPCSLAILSVYLFFLMALAAACVFFFPELISNTRDLMNTLPDIMSKYEQMVNGFLSAIKSSQWSDDVKSVIFKQIQDSMALVKDYSELTLKRALGMIIDTVTLLVDFTVALVIAYYFIKDAEQFKASVLSLVPRRWRNGIIGAGREINLILTGFIQGQLLTALIVGILETTGLMIVKVKYALVLGMVGGLANIIPYFGPFIGAIPAVAVSLIQSPLKSLWTILVFVIVQQIDNSFISPKVIEGRLGLHPVATIFAVLLGGEFFGILGMLLSVPVMAILKVIVKRMVDAIV